MRREPHVRFCERLGVRFPWATHLVVLRQSREEAEAALALVRAFAADTGLTLHPDKTRIGNSWKKGGGFSFLGYSFEGKRRHVRKKSSLSQHD